MAIGLGLGWGKFLGLGWGNFSGLSGSGWEWESAILSHFGADCNNEAFAALGAGRLGVADADGGKGRLEDLADVVFGFAGEGFHQKFPAGAEVVLAEVGDESGEFGVAGLVGVGDSGEVGREVGEDQVGGLPEGGDDFFTGLGPGEVALDEGRAGDGLDREEVGGDDFPAGIGELDGDLGPAAGRGAEVDDGESGPEELVGLVDLEELERGAGAVSFGAGGADERVARLPPAPLGGA